MRFKRGQWTHNYAENEPWCSGAYFDKKEEVIADGLKEYAHSTHFFIGEIVPANIGCNVDANAILEDVAERVYDEIGEAASEYLRDVTNTHHQILEDRLNDVVSQWMKEFEYEPKYFHLNNVERIEIK